MRTRSKKRNNYIHLRRRIKQRYGITINRKKYNGLCRQIKESRSIFLGRQTTSRTVHQINLDGRKLIVVYNTHHNNIVTVLHPGKSYKLV